MKSFSRMFIVLIAFMAIGFIGCSRVEVGEVGVKVHMLGGDKGVDHEVLSPGKYWIGMNEELYKFPTFTQNYIWTRSAHEGKALDESITFQDKGGLEINTDVGITFEVETDKVSTLYTKFHKGMDEIRDIYLRNMVRDAFVTEGSKLPVEQIYGEGKSDFMAKVSANMKTQCDGIGIKLGKLYLASSMRLPAVIESAINDKMAATQHAQQRENELREAEAAAKKKVADAQGTYEANLKISQSINANLIQWEAVKKWDGKLPQYSGGGAIPFLKLN